MRPLISIALFIVLPGVVLAFWQSLIWLISEEQTVLIIGSGFLAGIICSKILSRLFPGIRVFEHELIHAIAALCFLKKINTFRFNAHQGYVEHSGGVGGELAEDIIGLAPYMLPVFALVSVLIRPLVNPDWIIWLDAWIGFCLGAHALRSFGDTVRSIRNPVFIRMDSDQYTYSDIARRGVSYSLLFIVTFSLAVHGLLFMMIFQGYNGAEIWSRIVWHHSQTFTQEIATLLSSMEQWPTFVMR